MSTIWLIGVFLFVSSIEGFDVKEPIGKSTYPIDVANFTTTSTPDCSASESFNYLAPSNSGFIPIANDDFLTTDKGQTLFYNVLNNDTDSNNNIDPSSLEIIQPPMSGQVVLAGNGEIIYTPNSGYVGEDNFIYQVCDFAGNCDDATSHITIEENLLDPCSQANRPHTFYVPFPEDILYDALRRSTACSENLGSEVRSIITIKTPYPTSYIKYDHWEDGYETNLAQPIQSTTEIWGDGDITNGAAPGYPSDILPAGSSIVLDNTFNYTPPRNTSIIAYDGRDKIVSSADIALSKISGDINIFSFQSAKTAVPEINRFGSSFTIPFGEDLGNEFSYTACFVRAMEDNTEVTVDVNADGFIDGSDIVSTLNEGEVLFFDGDPDNINQFNDIKSGANVIATKKVGLSVLFGGIDCYGTRSINLLPKEFYSNTYYTPVPTVRNDAPARIYFYNINNTVMDINWTSNFGSGSFPVQAESNMSVLLPNINSAYKFENLEGSAFIAMEVIDSDTNGADYDWAFSLTGVEQLTSFSSIAWAPGSNDGSRNDGPLWVTPTANTKIYIKNDGDLTSGTPFQSPCGRAYDYAVDLNEFDVYKIRDDSDNDQSGTAIFTCDSTPFISIYGEDPSTAVVGNPSMDVGTTMEPFCSNRLILANDDEYYTIPDLPIDIDVVENDAAFLLTIDPSTISLTGTLQPSNGSLIINPDYSLTYFPNIGWQGVETFEYRICSVEDPSICDIATVTLFVADCGATPITALINSFTYLESSPDNGAYDGEPIVPGIDVDLYFDINGNGIIDTPEDVVVQTTTSNISGFFSFNIRSLGNYIVKVNVDDGLYTEAILNTASAQFLTFNTCVNGVYLGVQSQLIAVNDTINSTINTPQNIDVLSNDIGQIEPSSLTTNGLLQPVNGTIIVESNNTITYMPNPGFEGEDKFEYQICNPIDLTFCDIGIVYVTVNCDSSFGANTISGSFFSDENNNGTFDGIEGGVSNVMVDLYQDINENGLLDPGDILIDSVETNSDGTYLFSPNLSGPLETVFVDIVSGANDVEERLSNGIMSIGGNVLDMGILNSGAAQIIGLRYSSINIPSNAIIQNAYVEFQSRGNHSQDTDLVIYGEDTPDPAPFENSNYNVSSRVKTDPVFWDNVESWTNGNKFRTPSVVQIIQSIIDQPGWASGNDLVLMVEGDGRRRATSFENGTGPGPTLVIQYITTDLPAHFVLVVDESQFDSGIEMTTDNIETAIFYNIEDTDCGNNFGAIKCPDGCPPIANDDFAITEENVSVVIDVLANDLDPDLDLDLTSVGMPNGVLQPENGTTTIDQISGAITYTPNNNVLGLDSFEYIICDLSVPTPKCDTAMVIVDVVYCNIDFDEVKIHGRLFVDNNENGSDDDTDTGLQGIPVNLFLDNNCNGNIDSDDAMVQSVMTDANGFYEFIEITVQGNFPYCYNVQMGNAALPNGYVMTTSELVSITFSGDSTCSKEVNFGTQVYVNAIDDTISTLTHFGFLDIDILSNDSGNYGAPFIVNNSNNASISINPDGSIRFIADDDSIEGTYVFGYGICSLDDASVCDSAKVFVNVADCLANPRQKIIRGKVFVDSNENGLHDLESGMENIDVKVYEDVNQNGLVDDEDVLLATETTDALGDYIFTFSATKSFIGDNFSELSYGAGLGPWTTDWIETDVFGNPGPIGNYVGIIDEELAFHWVYQNEESIRRSIDLTGNIFTALSFDWRTVGLDVNESLSIQVSQDGTNFTTIGTLSGNQEGIFSHNITSFISDNTSIRFISESENWEQNEYVFIDDVKIKTIQDIGHFVIETDIGTHPDLYSLTTDNVEIAVIDSLGNCDAPNNFGLQILDYDKDGVIDIVDLDDDNDGIPDLLELSVNPLLDLDSDEVPVYLDDNDFDPMIGNDDGMVSTDFDLDSDNIPNHFDLDSDNDGCSDANEANHNYTIEIDNTVSGPFGINGLSNGLENNDTPSAIINYNISETVTNTYDFLNPAFQTGCNKSPIAISDINATESNVIVTGNLLTNDFDPDNNEIIIDLQASDVSGGSVVIEENGKYKFIPDNDFVGEAIFSYIICDDGLPVLCDTAVVNIDVLGDCEWNVNQISGLEDHYILDISQELASNLIANDNDPEGDSIIINTNPVVSPTFGTLEIFADGSFLYAPVPGIIGEDAFKYEICDDGLSPACDVVQVTIKLLENATSENIYATDDAYLSFIDTDVTGDVRLNDVNPIGSTLVDTIPLKLPQNGTLILNSNGHYTYSPDPNFRGNDEFIYKICDTNDPQKCDSATVYLTILNNRILLDLKVMLSGPLYGSTDSLMRADLALMNLIPLNQPYSATFNPLFTNTFIHTNGGDEVTTNSILNTGIDTPNGIVDWVFIEIRDPIDSTTIRHTISALLQRDGDIVDAGTGGNLYVNDLIGEFFVVIKHRNHLGVMTASPISILNKTISADFTSMDANDLFHNDNYDGLEQTNIDGLNALWAGNSNSDSKVKYSGIANDRLILVGEIISTPGNIDANLNYNNSIGYYQGDLNMDGKVKHDGILNDRILMQNIMLTYPENTLFLNNFNLMIEQIK